MIGLSARRIIPLLNRNEPFHQIIRTRLKRFGERPLGTPIQILGQEYLSDEKTNIPNKVIALIERPDRLYMTEGNPIYLIVQSLREHFHQFRCFHYANPVVNLWQNFDSILVPESHISRRPTDTFYVDRQHVLRSHTSAHQSQCFKQVASELYPSERKDFIEECGKFMIIGDVYRRDEVNRTHHAAFHQAEIVELFSMQSQSIQQENIEKLFDQSNCDRTKLCQERHWLPAVQMVERRLKSQVESFINRMFGQVEMRWVDAYFPFTHPSWELEVKLSKTNHTQNGNSDEEWLELLGCGIIEQKILDRDGLHDQIGWALGLGLERLAMLYYRIPDIRLFWTRDTGFLVQFSKLKPFEPYHYKPISSYPQKIFDISFWLPPGSVSECWSANDVHAIILEIGGELVEQAHLVDEYTRSSDGRRSNCYRIVYRSHERALTNDEVNLIHKQIEQELVNQLNVTIR